MAKDLRSYMDELLEKRPQDVAVVDREVDPHYEAAAIVEKFERDGKAYVRCAVECVNHRDEVTASAVAEAELPRRA